MEKEAMDDWDDQEASHAFLSSLKKGDEVAVRDDLYDFQLLLDAVKLTRRKGIPFRLIDSGTLDILRLEWLANEGAAVYSSDPAPRSLQELERVGKACKRGGAFLSYFHNASLASKNGMTAIDLSGLMSLAAEGVYIFISSKEEKRDLGQLCALADRCRRGRSWLVYYHHGRLEGNLVELARNGAWIHIADSGLGGDAAEHTLLLDVTGAALASEANLVLHLNAEMEFYQLNDIQKAGAFLLFHSPLLDYRSPLKPLKEKASNQKLDPKAFYLYSKFFF